MSDTIRLHWFWSTNPQKVRLALEELGLSYELAMVDLYKGGHKTAEYRAIHPRAKVPALEIDGGVLWDSNAAIAYLAEREKRHWPSDAAGRQQALNLLFTEASAFQDLAGTFFFNRLVMPRIGKEPDEARLSKAHDKLLPLFELLSDCIGEGDYLLDEFSLVDCSYAPWLPWLDLDEHPALVRWRNALSARESWQTCRVIGPGMEPEVPGS
jgi:glutathione S-transferase